MSHPVSPASDGAGSGPGPLDPALVDALREFAHRDEILIALDFDGVLAPFVAHPADARPLPETVEVLHRLSREPGVAIAYVSGRPVDDLRGRAEAPEGALFIGSHGAEADLGPLGGGPDRVDLSPAERERLAELVAALQELIAGVPGLRLEHKPAGVVLHTRGAQEQAAAAIRPGLQRIVERFSEVKFSVGHEVAEFAMRHADKGQGITLLRRVTGIGPVLFSGDDTTDEDAFAVLGPEDVGIKVGPGPTAARYRVPELQRISTVLETLLRFRQAARA